MTGRPCDVVATVNDRTRARLGIVDHEAGEDAYVVTEPKAYGNRSLYFCSLAHLAQWLRAAASGADRRAAPAGALTRRDR